MGLLHRYLGAGLLELGLRLFGIFLGRLLDHRLGGAVDQVLRLFQAQAGELAHEWITDGRVVTAFVQGTNLLDSDIRAHTSFLKDVAPLMGRSFLVGVRATF